MRKIEHLPGLQAVRGFNKDMPRKLRILILFLFLFGLAVFGGYRDSGYHAGLKPGSTSDDEVFLQNTPKREPIMVRKQDIAINSYSEGDAMGVLRKNEADQFSYEVLSKEIKERITGKSYGENCDVPYGELRYVRVLYWGFDNISHKGELIVNKTIAEDIVEIFKELYENKYPIERMVLVDEYDADDNTSMAADNTSAFNYRNIEGTSRISMHSYGLAVDINPLYNPYVRSKEDNLIIAPENAAAYTDRTADCKYYIRKGDVCYNAFIKRGFTWGGEWKTLKDYQHFQKEPES